MEQWHPHCVGYVEIGPDQKNELDVIGGRFMEERVTTNTEILRRPRSSEQGFSLLQLIVVLVVATIISTGAAMTIQAGRRSLRLANSAHQFAGYMERARTDSVRRRAQAGNESSVQVLNTTTYRVTM